ncbi:MAG: hypothetical protein AB7K71_25830 [Polyangiaceae bacterium]
MLQLPRTAPAGLLTLGAALLGCGSCEKNEERARLEGPVKVVFNAERRWSGGRVPGLAWSGKLSIERSGKQFIQGASCYEPKPELAGDGTSERLAYRCDRVHQWQALYVNEFDAFPVCKHPLGNAEAPDWSKIPADSKAGFTAIAECAHRYFGDERGHLIAYAKHLGDEYVVRLLMLQLDQHGFGLWESIADELDPGGRSLLVKELQKALTNPLSDTGTCRSLAQLPDGALSEFADGILSDATGRSSQKKQPLYCSEQLVRLLAALRKSNPKRAAEFTCSLFGGAPLLVSSNGFLGVAPTKLEALQSLPPASCPSLWDGMGEVLCSMDTECRGHLCSPKEVSAALAEWKAPPKAPDAYQRYSRLELLRIAQAQGPAPETLAPRLARLRYRTSLDACPDDPTYADSARHACCTEAGARAAACDLGTATDTGNSLCDLEVDDTQRLITARVRVKREATTDAAPSASASAAPSASSVPITSSAP